MKLLASRRGGFGSAFRICYSDLLRICFSDLLLGSAFRICFSDLLRIMDRTGPIALEQRSVRTVIVLEDTTESSCVCGL